MACTRRDLFRNVLIKWDRSWWLGWGSRSFSLQPLTIYFDSHSGLRQIRCRTFKVLLAVRSAKLSLCCATFLIYSRPFPTIDNNYLNNPLVSYPGRPSPP